MASRPDYLVIGHVTRDLQPDGGALLGGTALYAAITASQLGRRVAILTAGAVEDEVRAQLPDADLLWQPGDVTTTFFNRYVDGQRFQRAPVRAAVLDLTRLPDAWRGAAVVHLGPVAREIAPASLTTLAPAWLCATPQGWLRHWGPDGAVALAAPGAAAFADALIRALVVSEGEEESHAATLIAQTRARGGVAAITRGAVGSTLLWRDQTMEIPAFPVEEIDPTGAGDVYAAALFIRLAAGDPPPLAAVYASAAAALSVTGPGVSAIPDHAAIQRLMQAGT